jgi:hypothetical protein
LVASFIEDAIFPGGRKITADRSSLLVNAAVHIFADKSLERQTARFGAFAAFHNQPEVIELFSHCNWDASRAQEVRFSPIERSPVIGTAGPAC